MAQQTKPLPPDTGAKQNPSRSGKRKRPAAGSRSQGRPARQQDASKPLITPEFFMEPSAVNDSGKKPESESDTAPETPSPANGMQLPDPSRAPASAVDLPGQPESDTMNDPELLSLLEQLGDTIDTANQVLSVNKPVAMVQHRVAENDPDALKQAMAPPQPPKASGESRNRAMTAIMALGVLIVSASAIWLMRGTSLSLDGKETAALTDSASQSGMVRVAALDTTALRVSPVPAVDIPLPARKPQDEAAVTQVAALPEAVSVPALPSQTTPDTRTPLPSRNKTMTASGRAGELIDLALPMRESRPGDEISIMIKGVPEDAKLSAGNRIGGGTWILDETHAQGLKLSTPATFTPRSFALDVAMVKSDGKVPVSRSLKVTVKPVLQPVTAAAPAPVAPAEQPPAPKPMKTVTQQETKTAAPRRVKVVTINRSVAPRPADPGFTPADEKRLLEKGKQLLERGDVASARLVLEHAARRGSKPAMIALGKTYDPQHLARLGVLGVAPDQAQASAWYERASSTDDR